MALSQKSSVGVVKNRCRFWHQGRLPTTSSSLSVDYKDVQTLKKMCNSQGKMMSLQTHR